MRMTRVVAIANQKGGVAKTTSTHALGVAMAERGRKILLVDLDPQASLTWACGVDPDLLEVSIHDVLLKRAKAEDAIVALPTPAPAKEGKPGVLHLLPSTIDLAGAELHLLTKTGREYVLRKALSKVADRYDRVLIDCPPSLGILTINGLTAADEVVIPLQCESLSQRGVGQLLETIEDVHDYTNEDLEVRGASTDVSLFGTLGTVRLRTASGDVRADRVSSLEVNTASGDARSQTSVSSTRWLVAWHARRRLSWVGSR